MRKQEQSRKSKEAEKKNVNISNTSVSKVSQNSQAKNLSLIFSKLAEFEDKRSDEEFFRLLGDDEDPINSTSIVNLSEELVRITALFENNEPGLDTRAELKMIFEEKINSAKEFEALITPALVNCRATYKKKDQMIVESLRLKQDIHTSEASFKEKAEMCRNLQARNKEYEATSQLLLIEEAKKTEELRTKCLDSITSITKQIEDEETVVSLKKLENENLSIKITEFNSHLLLRDEHLATQRKARVIEQQLLDAKNLQYIRAEEQRHMNSKSYQNHLNQLSEAVIDLERQVALYIEKASSFEATLDDTKSVFQQFEDRADTMIQEVEEIEAEIQTQLISKAEKETKLEKLQRYIISANMKINEMKLDHNLADKCRALQVRRTDLSNNLALLNPPSVNVESVDEATKDEDVSIGDVSDDRPTFEVPDTRSGRSSPHPPSAPDTWVSNTLSSSSSSGRSCSTPPSSSSRIRTESSSKENTAGEDTPSSSPSISSPKKLTNSSIE
mmetsp:Transcript_31053/g.29652  ORF Transcript_31053/g.29652 Transcript_31053/m.29652 type:complete len:502 (-) Transcript_31053:642-2147(-)